MKDEKDYIKEISEIRSMMERSSRFLSLSGLSGVMAGIYALAGALVAYLVFGFNPDSITYSMTGSTGTLADISSVIIVALIILALALGTVVYLSRRNAGRRGEKMWSATTRRLLANMMVPLSTGGVLILIFIVNGLTGLVAPLSMIFYGLALFTASKMTLEEVKFMGIIQIVLGLIAALMIQYSLIIWALGFGVVNIVYGIYMHYKYER